VALILVHAVIQAPFNIKPLADPFG